MTLIYNRKKQTQRRKDLRNNCTKEEKIIWNAIRKNQLEIKFRRQYGIGHYVVDFCAPTIKLIIEIDGESHLENKQIDYDAERTKNLKELGFTVIRFWNTEVKFDLDDVVLKIKKNIKELISA